MASAVRGTICLAFLLLCVSSSLRAQPQGKTPASQETVTSWIKDGMQTADILNRLKNIGIEFRITPDVIDKLKREAGASQSLIEALRSIRYVAPSKPVGDLSKKNTELTVPPPKPPRGAAKKIDTIFVLRTDTVYVGSSVAPNIGPTNAAVDVVSWDFRRSKPLTAGTYNNCKYDYSPTGYTVQVLKYGGSCLDGSMVELDSVVTITTKATPVSGSPGYTYGLRFGISDDPAVGYYAFEVSSYGHYELSRYRNGKWEVVFPWRVGSAINAKFTNVISAAIHGSKVAFTINGITQYVYEAPSPIRGRAGFGIIGFDDAKPLPTVTFATFNVTGQIASSATPLSPTVPGSIGAATIDWDFRTNRELTAGRYGKCQYDYSTSGYTISVAEAGTTCIDGPPGDQPAQIRVAATAQGLRGGAGYTYGLRFGYTPDSTVGYYAFELSEGGSFQLSRYRMHAWEPLIPWERTSIVHPAASGIPNDLAVEIRGRSVTLFVNGQRVGAYETPKEPVGPAGFGIIGYDQTLALPAVRFSRFSIAPIN